MDLILKLYRLRLLLLHLERDTKQEMGPRKAAALALLWEIEERSAKGAAGTMWCKYAPRAKELAFALGISASVLSGYVTSLLREGLIEERSGPGICVDRRHKHYGVTGTGKKELSKWLIKVLGLVPEAYKVARPDPVKIQKVVDLFSGKLDALLRNYQIIQN